MGAAYDDIYICDKAIDLNRIMDKNLVSFLQQKQSENNTRKEDRKWIL